MTKILQPNPAEAQKSYNYLVEEDCSMNGLCLSISYQALILYIKNFISIYYKIQW